MKPEYDFDLFVIGAGSGGVRAARIAAAHGARVGICEASRVGGTCVIRGCVPKKLLSYAAHFADDFEDAAGYGWEVGKSTFDWSKLIANKDRDDWDIPVFYAGEGYRDEAIAVFTGCLRAPEYLRDAGLQEDHEVCELTALRYNKARSPTRDAAHPSSRSENRMRYRQVRTIGGKGSSPLTSPSASQSSPT